MVDLKGRNFLKLLDYTPEEITYLLDLAAELKEKKKKGIPMDCLILQECLAVCMKELNTVDLDRTL